MKRRSETVMGICAPAPRVTARAIALAVVYVGLPLLGALLLVDVALWGIVKLIWGGCYGVWCWF